MVRSVLEMASMFRDVKLDNSKLAIVFTLQKSAHAAREFFPQKDSC